MSLPRVLVADDQPDVLHALRLLLTDAGCEADLVSSADAALVHAGRRPYDLALLDLNYTRDTTSGHEGLDLVARMHRHDASLPIVVMTGWGAIETAVEAMRRGARSYVQKPWDDATLMEIVRREIAHGRACRRDEAKRTREHEDARAIQRMLLPVAMPVIAGCAFAAVWTPAAELGGDCYDLLRLSETRVAIAIADVVGKGLPAALLMANVQASVRAFATAATPPHDVCDRVNQLLCGSMAAGKFVTACYAVLDTEKRRLTYANAGHNAPMLVHGDGRIDRLTPTGRVFGVTRESTYTMGTLPVDSGDRLVLFTDGVTEARSADGTELGEDRLADMLRARRDEPVDALARAIADAVDAWTNGAPGDDVTVIIAAVT